MICMDCREAGDRFSNAMDSKERGYTGLWREELHAAEKLHAKCSLQDCFCQHRLSR